MANWTDCTMRFLSEDEKTLKAIEKEAEKKEFCDYYIIDGEETEFFFNCSGKWNADYEWFKHTCEKYSVAGKLTDGEGTVSENEYDYLCPASIADYGKEYFIELYGESFESPEHAEYVLDALELTGDDRDEAMRYMVNVPRYRVEPTAELQAKMDKLFKGAPKIGTTAEETLVYCQINELIVAEAEPSKNGYRVTAFDDFTKQWVETEIILGDIELAEKLIFNEDVGSMKIDEDGNTVA